MSKFILSLLDFSISLKDKKEFPYTDSFHNEYNTAKSMTMSKRQSIRSFLVIGCDDKKKKFAI